MKQRLQCAVRECLHCCSGMLVPTDTGYYIPDILMCDACGGESSWTALILSTADLEEPSVEDYSEELGLDQ